jgi:hypothetical protein
VLLGVGFSVSEIKDTGDLDSLFTPPLTLGDGLRRPLQGRARHLHYA